MHERTRTVCLVILTVIAVGAALSWLRPVMIPFVLAVFIALALRPLIDLQQRWLRLPYPAALATTLVLGLVGLLLLGSLVSASVSQLAANATLYSEQLSRLVERSLRLLPGPVSETLPVEDVRQLLRMPLQSAGGALMGTANAVLDVLSQSVLVLIFVAFLLIGGGGREATGVWREAELRIERFLVTKAVISGATGLGVGLVLSLLGVPLALVFGLFAFLLNFIPSLGSIVATLLPLPVVIVDPQISPAAAVAAIALPGALQVTVGNVIEPRVMGSSLDLHPVVILLTLILWGTLWGIVGMLLATPITAVMKILLERFEGTRVLADVMAGRLDALRSPEVRPPEPG